MMERILFKSEALQEQKEPRPIWSDAKKKLGRRKKKRWKKNIENIKKRLMELVQNNQPFLVV